MNIDLASVSPAPSEEEAAAIAAAVTMMWPQPVTATRDDPRTSSVSWRFSGRWWASNHISRRIRPGA